MQAEERRWGETERLLRRLVGRLCAGSMGGDPRFDDELRALAAANRRNASAEELARMADRLTTAVGTVEAVEALASAHDAPVPAACDGIDTAAAAQTTTGMRTALRALLEELPLDSSLSASRTELLAELSAACGDATLAAVICRAADLIGAYGDSTARERRLSAAVLGEVTRGLELMAAYLTQSGHARQHGYDAARSHNDSVMGQMRELDVEVSGATELSTLQLLVKSRLQRVTREVCDFRAREETRMLKSNGKTERMVARIVRLERETQELHAKLELEKQDARLDTLTGVANRKSFDERLAVEIARRQRINTPGVVIVWDIDDFKHINDTYGHRAGDRVLQNVAACFKTGARRAGDLSARIGGEEFATILDGIGMMEALKIANAVRSAVQALRFHFRGTPILVTVSCGITDLRSPDTVEAAFDRADSALYRAKRGGKNVCIAA